MNNKPFQKKADTPGSEAVKNSPDEKFASYTEVETQEKPEKQNKNVKMTFTGEAKEKKSIPIYEIVKDGNGYEYKVANMNHPSVCKRSGIIEIEAIHRNNRNEPTMVLRNVQDPDNGVFFGIPQGIDQKTKALRWQRFQIGDTRRYDLSNPKDAAEWAVVSRAPWLQGSMYQRGKPRYRKFDIEAEAQDTIRKSKLKRKASEIVENMKAYEMFDMARNLGENTNGYSMTLLQAKLMEIAERRPDEFMSIWEGPNKGAISAFNRAKSVGLIEFHLDKGYLWKKGLPMGSTEAAALKYIIDNPTLLATIEIESKALDKSTDAAVQRSKNTAGQNDAIDQDDELLELKMEAKMLGVEGVHIMNKQELAEAIARKS